jgi:hypothetical protein
VCRGWTRPCAASRSPAAASRTPGVVRTRTRNLVAPNLLLYNDFSGVTPPDSCDGICGLYSALRPCQCDVGCVAAGDCCTDVASLCAGTSCQGRCGNRDPSKPFQCDAVCGFLNDCAADFTTTCNCS